MKDQEKNIGRIRIVGPGTDGLINTKLLKIERFARKKRPEASPKQVVRSPHMIIKSTIVWEA